MSDKIGHLKFASLRFRVCGCRTAIDVRISSVSSTACRWCSSSSRPSISYYADRIFRFDHSASHFPHSLPWFFSRTGFRNNRGLPGQGPEIRRIFTEYPGIPPPHRFRFGNLDLPGIRMRRIDDDVLLHVACDHARDDQDGRTAFRDPPIPEFPRCVPVVRVPSGDVFLFDRLDGNAGGDRDFHPCLVARKTFVPDVGEFFQYCARERSRRADHLDPGRIPA